MSKRELTELRSRVNSQMLIIDELINENKRLRSGEVKRVYEEVTLTDGGFLPSEIKKRLKMLCHPDRHNGSEMSTKVSQWLNRL